MEYIIYKYTSKSTGKTYVGRTSKSLEERAGKDGKAYHCCPYFFEAIQKQGWEDFEPSVLETVRNPREARKLEHKYILELNTVYPNGYNTTGWVSGLSSENPIESNGTFEYNPSMISKETSEMTKKQIVDYYKKGMSTKDIASELEISRSYVYAVLDKEKVKTAEDPDMKRLVDELESTKRSLEKFIEENKKLKEENDLYKKLLIKLTDK